MAEEDREIKEAEAASQAKKQEVRRATAGENDPPASKFLKPSPPSLTGGVPASASASTLDHVPKGKKRSTGGGRSRSQANFVEPPADGADFGQEGGTSSTSSTRLPSRIEGKSENRLAAPSHSANNDQFGRRSQEHYNDEVMIDDEEEDYDEDESMLTQTQRP